MKKQRKTAERKKRHRKCKIGNDKLNSLQAEFYRLRAERYPKIDIYMRLAAVYGCGWQCVYNALRRAEKNKQTALDVY